MVGGREGVIEFCFLLWETCFFVGQHWYQIKNGWPRYHEFGRKALQVWQKTSGTTSNNTHCFRIDPFVANLPSIKPQPRKWSVSLQLIVYSVFAHTYISICVYICILTSIWSIFIAKYQHVCVLVHCLQCIADLTYVSKYFFCFTYVLRQCYRLPITLISAVCFAGLAGYAVPWWRFAES